MPCQGHFWYYISLSFSSPILVSLRAFLLTFKFDSSCFEALHGQPLVWVHMLFWHEYFQLLSHSTLPHKSLFELFSDSLIIWTVSLCGFLSCVLLCGLTIHLMLRIACFAVIGSQEMDLTGVFIKHLRFTCH
uniref:Vesicle-associated protein 1-1-like n=1 Tax=Rhizophora mucronata TaxID=61149 RepID=A0A2P2JZG9_RHIMU